MILTNIKQYIKGYFNLTNDLENEDAARELILEGVSFKGANIVILIMAIFIASLGLNTNSAAVIIGAMLISPLMGPIIGMGLGVGTYDFDLIKRSLRNLSMAALFSVIASTIYFLISPVSEGRSELLARTSPTIYDVLIGFFGGGAGIVAIACKQKGNVIPGVAIATALMPPLCTAGYGLATWQLHYFFGAFYLFLINSIFISLATLIGVKLFKFKTKSFVDDERKKKVKKAVYAIVAVTLMPSIYLTFLMINESYYINDANNFIEQEFKFPNTQVFNKQAYIKDWKKHINVTLIGSRLNTDSLKVAMTNKLNESRVLRGTILDITQGFAVNTSSGNIPIGGSMREIYDACIKKIDKQAHTIDSLRTIVRNQHRFDSLSYAIAPEIKVLYPNITDIALNRSVFCNMITNKIDTTNIALIEYSSPLGNSSKFKEYLEARTGLKDIHVIQSPVTLVFKQQNKTANKQK